MRCITDKTARMFLLRACSRPSLPPVMSRRRRCITAPAHRDQRTCRPLYLLCSTQICAPRWLVRFLSLCVLLCVALLCVLCSFLCFVRVFSAAGPLIVVYPLRHADVQQIKDVRGLALQDIVTETHKYIMRMSFPAGMRIYLLDQVAEIEYVVRRFCLTYMI